MKVVSIVPQLPPSVNGLGDYGLNLARQLRQNHNIQTSFVIGDPSWVGPTEIEHFPILKVQRRMSSELVNTLLLEPTSSILLHYVGYGFAERGTPIWLIQGLEQWRRFIQQGRVTTVFHEIAASGYPFWTSAFWLSPIQMMIARRLSELSNIQITSRFRYAKILRTWASTSSTRTLNLPVFSNVGELPEFVSLSNRARHLVIFGHVHSRAKAYLKYGKELNEVCSKLEIAKVLDIGKPLGLNFVELLNTPVEAFGVLPAQTVSNHLRNAIAGFLCVPEPEFLAKSGIFAAYCAHGLLPITAKESLASRDDGLVSGTHYWAITDMKHGKSVEGSEQIARAAYSWYKTHDLTTQAKIFCEVICER